MIRIMYRSIMFLLGHLSDQTEICTDQPQKCPKMSDNLPIISTTSLSKVVWMYIYVGVDKHNSEI